MRTLIATTLIFLMTGCATSMTVKNLKNRMDVATDVTQFQLENMRYEIERLKLKIHFLEQNSSEKSKSDYKIILDEMLKALAEADPK